jgi:hypothetical protein
MLDRSAYSDIAGEADYMSRRIGFPRQNDPVAKKN